MVLKEYIKLISLVVLMGIGFGMFIGGCVYGKKDGEAERNTLATQVDTLQTANQGFKNIEDLRAAVVKQALEDAEEWKKKADAAEKRVADANKQKDAATKKALDALERATQDPDCAQTLEAFVCPAVPLP